MTGRCGVGCADTLRPFVLVREASLISQVPPGSMSLPQIDTIAWVPCPAVFEVGEFALVPRSNSLGVLEVKSFYYDPPKFEAALEPGRIRSVTELLEEEMRNGLGADIFGLGVICLRQANQGPGNLEELRNSGRAVVLVRSEGRQKRTSGEGHLSPGLHDGDHN